MYHDLFRDASFWSFLFDVDQELAATTRKQGCSCGGRLHRADYRFINQPDTRLSYIGFRLARTYN